MGLLLRFIFCWCWRPEQVWKGCRQSRDSFAVLQV